jgi:PleD family two-component response regulator
MTRLVLLAIPDLLLASRVNAAARAAQVPTMATFTPHDLLSKAHAEDAHLLLVDLSDAQMDPLSCIRDLRADQHVHGLRIVGFLPKADAESDATARKAGCDLVMSRSQLMESLPSILDGTLFT